MTVIRVGLCVLLAGSVLAFGAVEVWSESLLEIAAALLFLFWAVLAFRKQSGTISWSPLYWPLLGFIALGLLQLIFHATAYGFLTRTALLELVAYFLVFFLSSQAFRTRSELSRLAWFVILLCFAISLFGIIQYFTSGTELYWSQNLQTGGAPFGPYVNRNHFAGFVELTLPIGLAMLAFQGVHRELFPLASLLTIVPISALFLSGSRAGIIGLLFEMAVLALLLRTGPTLAWKGPRWVWFGVVTLITLALIAWVGVGMARERFSNLNLHDVSLDRRVSMCRGAARIFLDYPIKGCGLGTLIAVYPRYETAYDGRVVDHVHNDYMETLAETGLLGGLCGLSFLWLLYREARKNFVAEQRPFSRALHAGAITGVSGILLHSFVDFNLHIPANALLFLLMAYLATSLPLGPGAKDSPRAERPRSGYRAPVD
jgi:O-antigen ligase